MPLPAYLRTSSWYHSEEKLHLEWMLQRHPDDNALLSDYFDLLLEISRHSFGLQHALLPGIDQPLFFRANTSDIQNICQIFKHQEYGFEFPFQPKHILDLGGYCGYAAIYLAARFPNAQIFCVEPSRQNFDLLTINTMPYHNIRRIHGAVWHRTTQLELSERIGGLWGSVFKEGEGTKQQGTRAYTMRELLGLAGWPAADFIKCDIEGAELEVFSDPEAFRWIQNTAIVAVETHDRFKPGSMAAVEGALPPDLFDRRRSGEFLVFVNKRQSGELEARAKAGVEPILFMRRPGSISRFNLANVSPEAWGITAVDGETLQLHPNLPGHPPAEIMFPVQLERQRQFRTICHLAGGGAGSVVFSFKLHRGTQQLASQRLVLAPGETQEWITDLPTAEGPCTVTLGTEMAPEATSNSHAWAWWRRPLLQ